MRRETAAKWTCARSGDCCLAIHELVVTPPEAVAMDRASGRPLVFEPHEDARFLRMLTPAGCPLLAREADGKASCSIHAARPYQCRRFMCGRVDVTTEGYEPGGPMGCKNLSDRIDQSYHFAAFYRTNQRYAQREWAEPMGWPK